MFRMQLKDIKAGDVFWECTQHGQAQFRAIEDCRHECGGYSLQAHNPWGNTTTFFELENSPYGLSLYDSPAYLNVETSFLNGIVTRNVPEIGPKIV